MKQEYFTHITPEGLRIIHYPDQSTVSYCGVVIDAGTRDENSDESGFAHLAEHLLFKGTYRHSAAYILNRIDSVGGEINAYTTKEETFYYCNSLNDDLPRAIKLLGELVYSPSFPECEIEKEIGVILDEIASYEDNPSELIFDEFESKLYNNHPLGRNILGEADSLKRANRSQIVEFHQRCYQPSNMVFFCMGNIEWKKLLKLVESSLNPAHAPNSLKRSAQRGAPTMPNTFTQRSERNGAQSHILIGGGGYSLYHPNRLAIVLLNNILGGPGMNSRLNIGLREKKGLVYSVESSVNSFVDAGYLSIYMGCDNHDIDRCLSIVEKEYKKLVTKPLSSIELDRAKKQLFGQISIQADNRENSALGMAKSYLRFGTYDSLSLTGQKLHQISEQQLWETANYIFDSQRLSMLIYT